MSIDFNERGYYAAIRRNIKQNARITRERNWLAANPSAQRIIDWFERKGEFAAVRNAEGIMEIHPACVRQFDGSFGDFLNNLRNSWLEWGHLSEKQTAIVLAAIDRAVERLATAEQRAADRRAANALSQHVGTVGARGEWTLRLEKVIDFDSQFGRVYINLMRDEAGNIVVYKGSNSLWFAAQETAQGRENGNPTYTLDLPRGGVTLRFTATVKAHGERDGAKQTILARPAKVTLA